MTNDQIIAGVIDAEGGFVHHPADRGGPTNLGITMRTLAHHRRAKVSVVDIQNLTREEAAAIYLAEYIVEPGFNAIEDGELRALVVDSGVNHGTGRATKLLQTALGVYPDGVIGPKTLAALASANSGAIFLKVVAERVRLFGAIITERPSQAVFAKGWMARAAAFIEAAAARAA